MTAKFSRQFWHESSPVIVLFHPDYTVGPGIKPGLLTSSEILISRERSRADGVSSKHRRWGIAPRPENVVPAFTGGRHIVREALNRKTPKLSIESDIQAQV